MIRAIHLIKPLAANAAPIVAAMAPRQAKKMTMPIPEARPNSGGNGSLEVGPSLPDEPSNEAAIDIWNPMKLGSTGKAQGEKKTRMESMAPSRKRDGSEVLTSGTPMPRIATISSSVPVSATSTEESNDDQPSRGVPVNSLAMMYPS